MSAIRIEVDTDLDDSEVIRLRATLDSVRLAMTFHIRSGNSTFNLLDFHDRRCSKKEIQRRKRKNSMAPSCNPCRMDRCSNILLRSKITRRQKT